MSDSRTSPMQLPPATVPHGAIPNGAVPPGAPPCDGVVAYAGVDWWYHNRGHSECQILQRIARRTPVLWVNSIGMRAPTPGKTELLFRRYLRKAMSTLKGLRRGPEKMWIYSPLFLPRYTERAARWNGRLLRLQVKALTSILGMRNPSLWITVPTAAHAALDASWRSTVFNRSDDFASFPEVDSKLIRGLEEALLARSDHVLYVNRVLFERERGSLARARYIGHGVDFQHFAGTRDDRPPADPPEALRGLPRPVVGFYGALDSYTIDLELMVETARRIPTGTLLVIGPRAMDVSALEREPNVKLLPPVPYAEVPRYAAQFDVGIMPWLRNEWIRSCNPIKLKEYLALGFPVVSIDFPELAPFRHLVHAAESREEFLSALERALAEKDRRRMEERRAAVAADSWDALAEEVGELLGIPSPSGAPPGITQARR